MAAYFDDVSQPLRAVVAGKFAEGSLHFLHIGKHMPFDHHFGVGRHHEVLAEGFRWCESAARSPMMAPTLA